MLIVALNSTDGEPPPMPIIQLELKDRSNPKSRWLLEHKNDEYSQFGEDGIIAKILETIGTENSWCFEAGAWDGKYLSNTHALMKAGWSGVFVEGNSAKMIDLQATYGSNQKAHLRNAMIGLDGGGVDRILASTPIPKDFDLFSLDIDGLDYYVWDALSDYRPRIAIIEFNPSVPNDVVFVQDKNPELNQGCSLLALVQLGKRKGYELVAVTNVNAIFVLAHYFPKFAIADNSIDAMYFDSEAARIFQGYDGTIFTAGLPHLRWNYHPIEFEDLQVLPISKRRYGDAPPLPKNAPDQ
jgi:hypothetical protein